MLILRLHITFFPMFNVSRSLSFFHTSSKYCTRLGGLRIKVGRSAMGNTLPHTKLVTTTNVSLANYLTGLRKRSWSLSSHSSYLRLRALIFSRAVARTSLSSASAFTTDASSVATSVSLRGAEVAVVTKAAWAACLCYIMRVREAVC